MSLLIEEHPKANSYFEADTLLREAYYKTVKVLDNKNSDVFGTDALYPEFKDLDAEWIHQIHMYRIANVKEHTGYSLDDFLKLPIHRSETLIKLLMQKNMIKEAEDNKALDELKKQMK